MKGLILKFKQGGLKLKKIIRNLAKKLLKRFKKMFEKMCKRLYKVFKLLIIGLVSGIYYILERFYDYIVQNIKSSSKVSKMAVFYTMIALCIIGTYNINTNKLSSITYSENVEEIVEEDTKPIVQNTCALDETSCLIYKYAEKYGVDPYLAIAISIHETGYYKSSLAKNYHNYGGNYRNGSFMKFETKEKGIEYMVYNLSVYYANGLKTIEAIGNIYCPVGINDNGTNKYWIPKDRKSVV